MPDLRYYFLTNHPVLRQKKTLTFDVASAKVEVEINLHLDWPLRAYYWSVFIPSNEDSHGIVRSLLIQPEVFQLDSFKIKGASYGWSDPKEMQAIKDADLTFTGRIIFYVEDDLSSSIESLAENGRQHGLHPLFYGNDYAESLTAQKIPAAFISHDSKDKDDLVRNLAAELSTSVGTVWYDEYSLKVGDNLRDSIDRGLKMSRFCILVLSKNFFSNTGWVRSEFDSIHMREMIEKKDVILPIWHNVSAEEVYNYNARLANKVGLPSSLGVKELAARLGDAMRNPDG